jgi:signal transduction histidine kinase/CheY-like chemotaxis protein
MIPRHPRARAAVQTVLVVGAYVLGAKAGLSLAYVNHSVTAVWPPTGVSLAALLIWGGHVVPGIAVGAFVANLLNGSSVGTSAAITLGNTLAPVAAWLALRLILRRPLDLSRALDAVLLLVVGGFAGALVSATLGTESLVLTAGLATRNFAEAWFTWWIGDAMGVVLVCPLILTLGAPQRFLRLSWRQGLEMAALLLVCFGIAQVAFGTGVALAYIVFPAVVWGAIRLQQLGATTSVIIIAAVDVLETVNGRGQFGGLPPLTSLLAVQAFNGAMSLTGLVLAAIAHQEREGQQRLQQAAEELEDRIEQRTGELRDARIAAETANAAKDEFLSRMSHELRTPMTAILGFTELIGLGHLDDQQRGYHDSILRASEHLLGLMNEVLDISRIDQGKLTLAYEAVSVGEVLSEVRQLLRSSADAARVELPAYTGRPLGFVLADRQRLRQILLNLMSNAIKYNRPEGRVDVDVQLTGAMVRIEVTDTGFGIAPDQMERLFRPFERLNASASGIEGTGLGLVLSRSLAQQMGGTLGVRSESGRGSTFWIELPASSGALRDGARSPYVHAPSPLLRRYPVPRTILYVEDVATNVALLEGILANRPDARLVQTGLGQQAIEYLRHSPCDLVLLDLHLPDVSGVDVLKAVRADPATASIPVVVFSADATPVQKQRATAAGADAYIVKPARVGELLEVLDRYLEEPQREPAQRVGARQIR